MKKFWILIVITKVKDYLFLFQMENYFNIKIIKMLNCCTKDNTEILLTYFMKM